MCVFDAHARGAAAEYALSAVLPRARRPVHVEEPCEDNLRRFYRLRLRQDQHVHIQRYVQDERSWHQEQVRAYVFVHRGREVRVALRGPAQ